MKSTKPLTMAAAGFCVAVVNVKSATAAFVGTYNPSNWTLTNINADGFVTTSGAPQTIQLSGGDNQSNSFGTTDYLTTAAVDGTLSFDWDFATQDLYASFDNFNFYQNGVLTSIYFDIANTGNGAYTTTIAAGDRIGFQIATFDNLSGRASVTISNFSAPVPEPLTMTASATALGLGWWLKRKQAQSRKT